MTCIAHGREEDDPEIEEWVIKKQLEDIEKVLEEKLSEVDLDPTDDLQFPEVKEQIKFLENNPLLNTAEKYRQKADSFLKTTYYGKKDKCTQLNGQLETVAWYQALLLVKLNRALRGFHEPATEDDFWLCDVVAQFDICKKAIDKSIKALREILQKDSTAQAAIRQLLVLLANISDRIRLIEEEI